MQQVRLKEIAGYINAKLSGLHMRGMRAIN